MFFAAACQRRRRHQVSFLRPQFTELDLHFYSCVCFAAVVANAVAVTNFPLFVAEPQQRHPNQKVREVRTPLKGMMIVGSIQGYSRSIGALFCD